MDEVFWQFDRDFSPASFLTEFKAQVAGFSQRQGVTKVPSIRERLLQCTPSMTSLFDRGITALVGLSDFFTAEIYLWLRSAEILIPDFASLVSFDNIVGSHIFPVSSVDFGFAALGYQAAHLFVGDIPIRADRNGNVPAPCTLIDRGSIAPPPDRGSQIRTLTR
jgi:DNA-binding LacI/PurR family transcriptional regulator